MGNNRDEWRIAELLNHGATLFREAGIESPQVDAELLVAHGLGLSRTEIYLKGRDIIDRARALQCLALFQRRSSREPLAYITGEREFWSYSFQVSPAVLIPRPETELLVKAVLDANDGRYEGGYCLDLCCGSGVIGIVLALELGLEVITTDISWPALEICRSNCMRHGVDHRVHLVQADLATCFTEQEVFPLITVNPPYVSKVEMAANMQPEVIEHEPRLALDGGDDGLELIARISAALPGLLAPGGDFFMEIGADQGPMVKKLFHNSAGAELYESIDISKDYSERDRLVQVRKKR